MNGLGCIVLGLLLIITGCEGRQEGGAAEKSLGSTPAENAKSARVKVFKSGAIELNGKKATVADLKEEFARLKKVGGTVTYYCEDHGGEPPPEAEQVVQAIIDAQLTIQFAREDFK